MAEENPDDQSPLGDPDLARAWLARFHQSGPGRQRRELRALLRANGVAPQNSQKFLDSVMAIDQAWHHIAAKLSRSFRRDPPAVTDNPGQFHREMAELDMAFGDIYAGLVDEITTGAAPQGTPDTKLILATGLALFHFGKGAKFLYCKTELPDPRYWQRMHALYSLAVSSGFADARLALFPTDEVIATCSQYWLRAVMLATVSSANFSPRQIDRTEEWLETWCTRISVDNVYDAAQHVYCVDVADAGEPRRIAPDLKLTRPLYVCTGHLHRDIIAARTQLVQDLLISSIGWYAENPLKDYFELLDRLKRMWVSAPSAISGRASARSVVPEGERIEVVREFEAILALIDAARGAGPPVASYSVIDRSETGFGLLAPNDGHADLGLLELVAVRQQSAGEWKICAVVRTTILPANRGLSVGFHLLARTAVPIPLTMESEGSGPEARHGRAFYLIGDTHKNHADSLLAPAGAYAPGHRLKVKTAGNEFLVRINRVIQRGEGWERHGFQVLGKT